MLLQYNMKSKTQKGDEISCHNHLWWDYLKGFVNIYNYTTMFKGVPLNPSFLKTQWWSTREARIEIGSQVVNFQGKTISGDRNFKKK